MNRSFDETARFQPAEHSAGKSILVLAPVGRDAEVIDLVLRDAGFDSVVCADLQEFCGLVSEDTAAGVVAEEALASGIERLAQVLEKQPPWSDLPIIVLTADAIGQGRNAERLRFFERLGNTTLLERPLHAETLKSAARAALRTRHRQYQSRRHLLDLQRAAEEAAARQDQLLRLASSLEERVQQRTQELADRNERLRTEIEERQRAEAALIQAQKMEAIGHLTGGIAHDFNNLLTAVIGNLELMRPRLTESRVLRWAENAYLAAERGAKVTSQLLAFSRMQRLTPRPVNVNVLIAGMGDLLSQTIGASIVIRKELDPRIGPALADSNQLELAVLNLAINARDAMPDGGTIIVSTAEAQVADHENDLAPGDYVVVSVADTGFGMPAEIAARAFDPFFTTKPMGKGTGLGLSQVYGMARQSEGAARIESEAGKGTTVRIFLRRVTVPAEEAAESAILDAARGNGETVLVIDDDADVRRLVTEALREAGFEVFEAESGAAGLEMVPRINPDLLLLDFAMPEMNGAEVALAVKAQWPTMRVLFMSGYADTAALDAVGGNASLVRKPFRPTEIAAAVRNALDSDVARTA